MVIQMKVHANRSADVEETQQDGDVNQYNDQNEQFAVNDEATTCGTKPSLLIISLAVVTVSIIISVLLLTVFDTTDESDITPLIDWINAYDRYLLNLLLALRGEVSIFDGLSEDVPQTQAIEWLKQDSLASEYVQTEQHEFLLERYMVALLYYSWNGDMVLPGDGPICEIDYDFDCNEEGKISYIHADQSGLPGELPSELGFLTSLTSVNLSLNSLTGSLPTELGALSELEYLDLGSNSFTGSLPTELGALSELEYLDLAWNDFTGEVPPLPSSLDKSDQICYLGCNSFSDFTNANEIGCSTNSLDCD